MSKNHQVLIERLLKGTDRLALAHFVDIVSEEPEFQGVRLNTKSSGLALAAWGAMGKQVKTGVIPESFFLASQESLYRLMKHSGVGLTPRHALVKIACGLGLGIFVAHCAQDWSEKDQLAFTNILEAMPANVVVRLGEQWSQDPLMKRLAAGRQDQLMEKVLLSKTSDDDAIRIMREGRVWTTEEADLYLEKRLWPDWQSGSSTKKLNMATDPNYATDNIPLVLKVSAQAWANTVFGVYSRKAYKLLEEIDYKLERHGIKLDLDIPDISPAWQGKYLQLMLGGHEVARGTSRLDRLLLKKINALQVEAFRQKEEIDWRAIKMVGLANITKPSEIFIHKPLVEALAEKCQRKSGVEPPTLDYDPSVQIILDAYWLAALPLNQLGPVLESWPAKVGGRGAGKPLNHDYHVHISQVLYERVKESEGQSSACDPLLHAFWFHFLGAARHNCRRVAKLAMEVAQQGPGSVLWNVRNTPEGFEPLTVADIGSIGVRGKPTPQGISAMKSVLLTLTMAISGTLRQENQTRTRPKM